MVTLEDEEVLNYCKTLYLCIVRKTGKINGLFQILVLYCFIVSIYNTGNFAPVTHFQNNHSTKNNGYSPAGGVDLYTVTTKPDNVVIGHRNLPTFSFKNHPNDHLAIRKAAETYLANSYSDYISLAKNIVVRLQPVNIIFPFHYFW